MAVVVSDNKGYTQDEFKEYLKDTVIEIVPTVADVQAVADKAATSETNASNYAKQAKDSASTASGAEDSAHQYSSSALQSATNASASETNAKTSETNAATSATNAEASNQSAKKWAEASDSPDGANDTDSSTGKTQSAKSWALAAKASEANAKTSEINAVNSARTLQADWNVTDTTLQSYIKNKPDVITFKDLSYKQTASYEKNTIQSLTDGLPDDITNIYSYGTLMTFGDYYSGGCFLLYAPHNSSFIYKEIYDGESIDGWRNVLDDKNFSDYALPVHGNADTATKATQDASGNNIVNTYARKDNASITNLTVTGQTSVPTANQGNSSNAIASTEFVAKSISALVNGAPEQLNTLNELATALGNDSNFSATITAELGKKLDESEASDTYVTKTSYSIDIAALKTLITDTVNTGITTALQKVFPVGSIYTSVTDSRNPNAILGFGTWESLPAGYGLVAQGTATAEDGSTLTFTAGNKYGEFKHQLTVGELANHIHPYRLFAGTPGTTQTDSKQGKFMATYVTSDQGLSFYCEPGKSGEFHIYGTGNNEHHNNISPCLAAYVWKRIS